jgi:hypothetical protein
MLVELLVVVLITVTVVAGLQWAFRRLTKAPSNRRSDIDEMNRFVYEVNRPILEPLRNPPAGYSSSRSFKHSDVAARIAKIAWFENCGGTLSSNVSAPLQRCSDWPEAVSLCSATNWQNVATEAQNQLTVWLHLNARKDFQRWNSIVMGFKASILKPAVEPAIRELSRQYGQKEEVLHSVQWDMLGALMENHYLYTGHKAFFFLELLELYEAGHFPCGWAGRWPDGKLCVF